MVYRLETAGCISSGASLTTLRSCVIQYYPLGFLTERIGVSQAGCQGLIRPWSVKPCITEARPTKCSDGEGTVPLGPCMLHFGWTSTGLAPIACLIRFWLQGGWLILSAEVCPQPLSIIWCPLSKETPVFNLSLIRWTVALSVCKIALPSRHIWHLETYRKEWVSMC